MKKEKLAIIFIKYLLFLNIKKCNAQFVDNGMDEVKFYMDIYDENQKFNKTINLNFNYTTNLFNEYDDMLY